MVNTAATRGGAARMASLLASGLNEHTTDINAKLYHSEYNNDGISEYGIKKYGSRYINAVLARLGGSFCIADFGFSDDLVYAARNADILHIHNLHGYYINFQKLFSTFQDKPIIWTWHDMWGATGRCAFSYDCENWCSGCQACPHKNYYPAAWFDRANNEYMMKTNLYSLMKNITIVSPSKWLAEIAIKRGFGSSQVKVIPNPIDTSKFSLTTKSEARNKLNLSNKFTVLFMASDCRDKRKGYDDFARLSGVDGWNFIAVGNPPKNPSDNVIHVGRIHDQSIISLYYSAADVMIIPSYADNYPNTVIESLMCGTPVFGYNEGGIPSQLDMGPCKVLPKGDWKGFQILLEDYFRRGGKSKDHEVMLNHEATKRWSVNEIVKKYQNLYKEILNY